MGDVGVAVAEGKMFGLPLICPRCPPKHYFGLLKGDHHPTNTVKPTKADVCPNCEALLVRPRASRGSVQPT